MADRDKFNGWTNYETWAVHLWIDNEQASQERWRDVALEVLAHTHDQLWDSDTPLNDAIRKRAYEDSAIALADRLKDEHEDMLEELDIKPCVFTDLLRGALSDVNWHEIARTIIDGLEP